MGWTVPTSPLPPRGEVSLDRVEDAYLTPVVRGELRQVTGPPRWVSGAVHDASGVLVEGSQRLANRGMWVSADPPRVRPDAGAEVLPGRWLYGGHWMGQFGHFLTETVTTLWPDGLDVDGLVFHAFSDPAPRVKPWQQPLLDLTGYGDLPVRVVDAQPVRVESLWVPGRSLVLNAWASPEAVALWDRMARLAGADRQGLPERLFLSRTAFHSTVTTRRRPALRTAPGWDASVDEVFAEAGFEVVHPERLPVAEQVRLAAAASVVAAGAGSALHLSAFLPDGRRVVDLGDERTPRDQVPLQRVIDAARRHEVAHVAYTGAPPEAETLLGLVG